MAWETAEKALAICGEHGAVEEWGLLVAPVSRVEAIGKGLSKAGFDIVVDPDCIATGRAAAKAEAGERN